MATNMKYQELEIEKIELDFDNPRIKQYLENYSDFSKITTKSIISALSGGSGKDSSSKYVALKESIKQNGGIFNPIIVNHITSKDRYVVIEGNTRLKFYQDFKLEDPSGPWDKIISIVYDDMDEDEKHAIRLQAHMVGARDWDAYSKAKYLDYLYNVEKKPMKYLKTFCGGQESQIRNLIDAYNDMENYYKPLCEALGFEPNTQHFSYYVELQKSSAKDSLKVHNYDESDFTRWILDEHIDRAESIRKLARVLAEEEARKTFFKLNLTEAIKKLEAKESDLKKIAKSDLYDLANEVRIKLINLTIKESEALQFNSKYQIKKEKLISLEEELRFVLNNIGVDLDE